MSAPESVYDRVTAVFLRLAEGDFAARMERTGDRGEQDTLAYLVNALAEELQARAEERARDRAALEQAVAQISDTLVRVASGDFNSRADRDMSGSPTDVLAFLVNSAAEELGAAFEELHQSKRRIEQLAKDDAIERMNIAAMMAAGLAHEVNNPLSYVMGNISFLATELDASAAGNPSASDGARSALEDALAGCRQIKAIVSKVRKLSPSGTKTGVFELQSAVDAAVAMVGKVANVGAVLRCVHEAPPLVVGDESALTQVIINLVHNAALAVEGIEGRVPEVLVRTGTSAAGEATVQVLDNGAGIAADVLPHIFEPFYTTRPVGQGTGLGLAISRSAVVSMGGQLTVQSALGEGSTFTVTLPAATEEQRASSWPGSREKPEIAGRNVLIIDDDPRVATWLARALKGHDCTLASSAEEGLALALRGGFDVLVCDLMMPGKDGAEVQRALRQEGSPLAERMLFLTGGAYTPKLERFVAQTRTPVYGKPIELAVLRRAVAAISG